MNTGSRIKNLRTEKGYTQEELGELLGVKKAAIQKYENGAIINLKVETIKKLSDIFNVSPNYIIGWEGSEPQNNLDVSRFFNSIVCEHFGHEALEIIEDLYYLNENGKDRVSRYIKDLREIEKYKADK